jgi:hypothetical protein
VAWNDAGFALPPEVIEVPVISAPTIGDDTSSKSGRRSLTQVQCRSPVSTTGLSTRPLPKNSSNRRRCAR